MTSDGKPDAVTLPAALMPVDERAPIPSAADKPRNEQRTTTPRDDMEQRSETISASKAALLKRLLNQEPREIQCIPRYSRGNESGARGVPMSAAQQRLWFIDQLGGGIRAAYHIPLSLRLKGTLDQRALQAALDSLVARHETLRTSFVSEKGVPHQVIASNGLFALTLVDLTGDNANGRLAAIAHHQREESAALFELSTGPLIRGRLLRLTADDHVLLITMHHIISDGWSIGILIREMVTCYAAHREGRSDPLAPLPIHYADYAQWLPESLQQDNRQRQLNYWCSRLAGAPVQLELPTDRPRNALQSYRGGSVAVVLDTRLSADLNAFAQRQGMTLFMVLYAGWSVLLARLSGQDDVVIGTPVANRPRVELEGLIGLFVNTLALRIAVASDAQVGTLLAEVKQTVLGAYDHQDVPFEQVVEALQPERSLGRNPVFQVMFALQNAAGDEPRWPGLSMTIDEDVSTSSPFDMLLSLSEQGGEIVGSVDYAVDLFDRATVEHWIACFPVLLRNMIGDSRTLVGELPMLTADERHRVIDQFNATDEPYAVQVLIHQLFEARVRLAPEVRAVVCEEHSLSYAELNRRANRLARYLRDHGVGPEQRVGICVERGIDMIVGVLAILKAGGAYVPLDPAYPVDRLAYMLDDSQPALVLSHGDARTALDLAVRGLPHPVAVVDLTADAAAWAAQPSDDLNPAEIGLTSRHLAYVIYTSGSTGRPKGIAVEHSPVINLIDWVNRTFGVSTDDTLLFVTSICFDLSVYDMFGMLAAGGTIWVARETLINDPQRLADVVLRGDITFWDSAPAALQLVAPYLTKSPADCSRLRLVFNSGDWIALSLPSAIAAAFPAARFISLGGATEATVWSNWYEVTAVDPAWRSIPYGRPIPNARYYILDAARQPVPRGVAGDLYIAGVCLARGYTSEALTRERFTASPFVEGERLYRTGDRARYFADGNIEFLGRSDFQVKIRGFRIELGEIEAQLLDHPGVRDAVALAREDAPGDQRLVAYYTVEATADGAAVSAGRLQEHLAGRLASYMVPAAYVRLEALPITANGKLDRRALPAPQVDAYDGEAYAPPQGPVEAGLATVWNNLLKLERVGRDDNFFKLGGHSLLGMQLIGQVRARFAVDLPVVAIFRSPTIRAMAAVVQSLQATDDSTGRSLDVETGPRAPGELVPLGFSQRYRWNVMLPEERRLRQLIRATQLHGPLDIDLIRQSVAHVVRRHEALRTRIVAGDDAPMQVIDEPGSYQLEVHDLRAFAEPARAHEVQRKIDNLVLTPIDPAKGPLFGAVLLHLEEEEHILVVAMHLLIADGFSMNILMRDVLTAYSQLVKAGVVEQAVPAMQLAKHAVLQHASLSSWRERHLGYWHDYLANSERLRFPLARLSTPPEPYGGATVPLHIDAERTKRLREWCRVQQTTLVMGMFTVYAAVVLRWCGSSDAVIRYQTNGRTDPRLEDAIGVFASVLNLRIQMRAEDSFADLLERITQTYCSAAEHADHSYIDAQLPRAPFTYNSTFNWVPMGEKQRVSALASAGSGIESSLMSFDSPSQTMSDTDDEPLILLSDIEDGIGGDIYFSRSRLPKHVMERFVENIVAFVDAVTHRPDMPIGNIALL